MSVRVGLASGLLAPASVLADHQHGMVDARPESTSFGVGLSFVAAQFDTMLYGGDYQGCVPSFRWSTGRFAAAADVGAYRLQENGRARFGLADPVVRGQFIVISSGRSSAGVVAAVSLPTGDERSGLGMGHAMGMPAAWGRWSDARFALDGSLGYAGGLRAGTSHDSHAAWPLVDPMNHSEFTWSARGDVAFVRDLRAGAMIHGANPIGDGTTRVVVGARVLWHASRVDSAFELQSGIVGDLFTVRGVAEMSLRF